VQFLEKNIVGLLAQMLERSQEDHQQRFYFALLMELVQYGVITSSACDCPAS
jgi:hypothetical protein